jgi:DNA-binding NarL/FixJ family response regulator
MEKKRLLICDDHLIFCEGIAEVIRSKYPNIEINISLSISEAQQMLNVKAYDVLIADIKLPDGDGNDFILKNKLKLSDTIVIVLSAYFNPYIIDKSRKAGVDYFLKKEQSTNDIFNAIEGNKANKLIDEGFVFDNQTKVTLLSKQEKEIVYLISLGHVSKEIAELLAISKSTVDTHRKNIHRKLNTTNTAELLKFVHENKV